MKKGIIIKDLNKLTFSILQNELLPNYDTISIYWSLNNEELIKKIIPIAPQKINLRGTLDHHFFRFCTSVLPKSVTIEGTGDYKLEYSFGLDVLKYKGMLSEFLGSIGYNGNHGVCTDFRHENVLHSGDAGAKFVEIDVTDYKANSQYYSDAIEVAAMRGMEVRISGNTDTFVSEMGANGISLAYTTL